MDSVLLILFCSGLSEGQDLFQLLKVSLGKVMYVFFLKYVGQVTMDESEIVSYAVTVVQHCQGK